MADLQGIQKLVCDLKDKKLAENAIAKLAELAGSPLAEGALVQALPALIECVADKSKVVSKAAAECSAKIVEGASVWAASRILTLVLAGMEKGKPAQKVCCVDLVTAVAKRCPKQVKESVVLVIPVVTGLVWDVKPDVQAAAVAALEAVCGCCGNADLDALIKSVVQAIQKPALVPECVEALAGCVFVQEVEAAALGVILPVLLRGLNHERTDVKRKCCVVIENMCKLVEHPREVQPLMPTVLPQLIKLKDAISDPEARGMAERATAEVQKAAGAGAEPRLADEAVAKLVAAACGEDQTGQTAYAASLCAALTRAECWDPSEWSAALGFLESVLGKDKLEAATTTLLQQCQKLLSAGETEWEEIGEGELCRAEFGLAYGARTLLTKTRLQLQRNNFYGLLGPNNCGKTTLMRAIAAEQVDGFPKRDVLRTVFVEHEIPEREVDEDKDGFPILNIDLKGIDWVVDMCNNVYCCDPKVQREEVAEVMVGIGFGNSEAGSGKDRAADAAMGVWSYSGGWKMKMQLCAAQLVKADVLMLDEPTGHLDVTNIAWLRGWLSTFMENGGSVIATSHDTGFLNIMCDSIVDFEDRKLRTFRGAKGSVLTEFVEKYPEKQGYFVLKNDVAKFVFPVPGNLPGVKSKSRHLVKMTDVTFQYPSRDTPTVFDIHLEASRVSRVAVIGANGAGKSTAIKLLTGELQATSGTVVRHPNLRMAYVAQHAFQHLEKHLTETPVQYILNRFAGGDDKEAVDFKAEVVVTEVKKYFLNAMNQLRPCEEKKDFAKAIAPEAILDRRENKKEKTKEYLTKLMQRPVEEAMWIERSLLEKMGMLAKVQREDEKQALAAGLMQKALTSESIEKHLADFGLDAEAASHTTIQSLSGGQKVKVVLAGSMWLCPHILILDEPTNYLDRDGLGALTLAINDFEGGVIIISHNREFCSAVATEKWIMKAGRLEQEGESVEKTASGEKEVSKEKEVKVDASGNVVAENEADLDNKKKKKEIKAIEKQLKDNKKKKTLSQEEVWELEDRLAKLQE
jgi:elongation factor 3